MVRRDDLRRIGALGTVAVLLVLSACGDDSGGGSGSGAGAASGSGGGTPIALTITETGCDPTSLSAAAGKVEFAVKNESGLKGEFEVISSTPEILTEEFLEDGARGTFTIALQPGQYQIICGAPSNTRADLVVTGEGEAARRPPGRPSEARRAVAAYSYVHEQTEAARDGTKQFTDAVRAGDAERPSSSTPQVRVPWEAIEPVAELFPDSDAVIDSPRRRLRQGRGRPRLQRLPRPRVRPVGAGHQGRRHGRPDGARRPARQRHRRADRQGQDAHDPAAGHDQRRRRADRGGLADARSPARRTATRSTDLTTLAANVDGSQRDLRPPPRRCSTTVERAAGPPTCRPVRQGQTTSPGTRRPTASSRTTRCAQADIDALKTAMAAAVRAAQPGLRVARPGVRADRLPSTSGFSPALARVAATAAPCGGGRGGRRARRRAATTRAPRRRRGRHGTSWIDHIGAPPARHHHAGAASTRARRRSTRRPRTSTSWADVPALADEAAQLMSGTVLPDDAATCCRRSTTAILGSTRRARRPHRHVSRRGVAVRRPLRPGRAQAGAARRHAGVPQRRADADQSHGDLLVQICGGTPEDCNHALRRLMRVTRAR